MFAFSERSFCSWRTCFWSSMDFSLTKAPRGPWERQVWDDPTLRPVQELGAWTNTLADTTKEEVLYLKWSSKIHQKHVPKTQESPSSHLFGPLQLFVAPLLPRGVEFTNRLPTVVPRSPRERIHTTSKGPFGKISWGWYASAIWYHVPMDTSGRSILYPIWRENPHVSGKHDQCLQIQNWWILLGGSNHIQLHLMFFHYIHIYNIYIYIDNIMFIDLLVYSYSARTSGTHS